MQERIDTARTSPNGSNDRWNEALGPSSARPQTDASQSLADAAIDRPWTFGTLLALGAAVTALHVVMIVAGQISAPVAAVLWLASVAAIIAVKMLPAPQTQQPASPPAMLTSAAEPAPVQIEASIPAAPADATVAATRQAGLADLVAALPDPVLIVDPSGHLIHFNDGLAQLFPKAREGIALNHISRNPELLEAVDRAVERGRITVELEERFPVRRRLTAVVAAFAETASIGEPAILIQLRDTSELERLAQMRADFIANASHELRTPLASLKGFIETLQGPARDDPVARERFLGIMATQAGRMTRLIDDLLSLSRVEMRAHLPPSGTVDLAGIVGTVAQALEPVALQSEVSIVFAPPSAPALVTGDRDELLQVMQNLIQNGIKYGHAGGRVEISIAERRTSPHGRREYTVSVADDGPGIAEEHLPRLTERFYRVNATVSRDKGGTGLGLAIVKNIVNRHRGELEIASEIGRGSVFTVVLPARNDV